MAISAKRPMWCWSHCSMIPPANCRSRSRCLTGAKANAISFRGKTAPSIALGGTRLPGHWERFTSLGPLLDKLGNGGKGIAWNTQSEVDFLGKLNYVKPDGPAKGRPRIDSAIDASEVILSLAPETNGRGGGESFGRRWESLPAAIIPIWRSIKRMRRSAFAIFRRSRAKLSPARRGRDWKASTSPTMPVIPTCMS